LAEPEEQEAGAAPEALQRVRPEQQAVLRQEGPQRPEEQAV